MFSCFLLDSFELQEWFVSQNMEPLSLRSTSPGVMMNILADTIIFFLMLETEEFISEIGIVITFGKKRTSCDRET